MLGHAPVGLEVVECLGDVVGGGVDRGAVPSAAEGDAGQLAATTRGEDVGAVVGGALGAVDGEGVAVVALQMRAAEGVDAPGYDGMSDAIRASPFVPEGPTVWESGVGQDPGNKAQRDYRARTDDPLGFAISDTTFVFVTPASGGTRTPGRSGSGTRGQPRRRRRCRSCCVERMGRRGAPVGR